MPDPEKKRDTKTLVWALVRLVLGQAQMIGAVAAAYLLLTTGLNPWSLGLATATTALTLVSRLLYASRDGSPR